MSQLWEPNPDYYGNLPYKRLYGTLTPERLSELLRDAEAQQWEALDLNGTNISEVPESITRLSSLKRLDLSYTNIREVPESITHLTNLQWLSLRGSNIRKVPESIGNLSSLQALDLSYTNIREVPESIGNLSSLRMLSLHDCHLKAIPYSLVTLELPFIIDNDFFMWRGINLTGVTLDEGDLQLFAQPRDVIEAYYRGQTQTLRECKVIFLGDGAVGKTSLIERIVNGTFTPGASPTDGIEVTKWYMSVKATEWETTVDNAPFTVRFLDFGGQEIMHAAHRCFLTAHTVYVVVCDSRDDEKIDDIASYWLESVKAFAPDCPVILALNKADLNPNASVNERDLKERNPALKRVLRTSAALEPEDDYGVSELIRAIRKQIPGAVNQYKVNVDMLRVKQALEDMRQQEGTGYITSERYREICAEHDITDKKLQYSLLGKHRIIGQQRAAEISQRQNHCFILIVPVSGHGN